MRVHALQRGFFGGLGLDVGIGRGHLVAGGGGGYDDRRTRKRVQPSYYTVTSENPGDSVTSVTWSCDVTNDCVNDTRHIRVFIVLVLPTLVVPYR
jgi:hypothetical protein